MSKHTMRWTLRDFVVLDEIADRGGFAAYTELPVLLGESDAPLSERAVRYVLTRWEEEGLIDRRRGTAAQPGHIRVTSRGRREIEKVRDHFEALQEAIEIGEKVKVGAVAR